MRTLFTLVVLLVLTTTASADRIKDLATVGGVRDNHLTGLAS